MSLFAITKAVARPDHTVAITWSDGVAGLTGVVDFLPVADQVRGRTPFGR